MLTYSLLNIGSDSLYEYLYKCIKNDILQGNIRPGEKLPSKRSFAKNLGISTITIENAYAQLMDEGYLYSIPKKGYFATDIHATMPLTAPSPSAQNASAYPSADEDAPAYPAIRPQYFANFTSNQTRPENFPFSIWAKLVREVLRDNQAELITNPPSGGILPLREAIASYLRDFRGMHVQPQQIIIGAGTEYLYGLLIQLLGRSHTYGIENPGYQKLARIYAQYDVPCSFIDIDHAGIIPSKLVESGADIIHVSPAHHFPTGITMPLSRRYELLGWACEQDTRYIIEDDYDSEFRLNGKPVPTLQSIDAMEKVIYMNTFTKSLASTIRISYMVLPPHLLNRFYEQLGFYSCTVSNFEQYTLARFIREGHFEKHINRMRNYYHTQRDALFACIANSPLAHCSTITEADAGLHFLLKLDTTYSDEELILRAQQKGIALSCLGQYYHETSAKTQHTLIINYSALSQDTMAEAIHRLCEIL